MAPKKAEAAHLPSPEHARELLQVLDAEGQLPVEWLKRILRCDLPLCQPACVGGSLKDNKKGNPRCLCGLVPLEGKERRKGLWTKEPVILSALGADPHDLARTVRGQYES